MNKLVTDLSNKDDNEQETSEIQLEDFVLRTNVLAFASRSKAKAKPRRRTSACSSTTITTVFRTITSVNQLSLYGAVAEMCEEYESYHAVRPVVGEQSSSSFVPSVIKINVLLNIDDPAHKELLLQEIRGTN